MTVIIFILPGRSKNKSQGVCANFLIQYHWNQAYGNMQKKMILKPTAKRLPNRSDKSFKWQEGVPPPLTQQAIEYAL